MNRKIAVGTYILLFAGLWFYLLLRIIRVPFLEDEIATWFIYIMHGHLLPMTGYVDANNHILNSCLAYFFAQFFEPYPAILRLPNFLFFLVYFYYSYKTSRIIRNRLVVIAVFLSLIMTHHLFDFFGLCRGYGLALALMMVTVYHTYLFLKNRHLRDFVVVLVSSFLMVWSHLSLLGVAYMLFAILFFALLLSGDTRNRKIWMLFLLIISFAITLSYSTWYSMHLQKIGKIYLGHSEGSFINVTVITLLDVLFRTKSQILMIPVMVFTLIIITGLYHDLINKGLRLFLINPTNIFAFLLSGNIIIILLNHWLFGIVYPEERGTLYLFPLFLISIGIAVDSLIIKFKNRNIDWVVAPLFLIPVHFLFSLNVDFASAYHLESYPVRYIRYIQQHADETEIYPIVGIYDEDRWVYDQFRYDGKIPFISENTYPDTVPDFQVGKFKDNPFFRNLYDSLDYDPRNDFLLLKRKNYLKRTPVVEYSNISTNGLINEEYFGLAPGNEHDSLTGTHFLYYYDLVISSPQRAFEGFIISSLKDTPIYEQIALDRVAEHCEKRRLQAGVLIRETGHTTKIPFAFFWNKHKKPFIIEEGSLTIYKIGE